MEKTVKQRLIEYIKYKNLTQREFANIAGVSSGYVNAIKKSIQPDTLHKISIHFPDLNAGWLITGEGEMLKPNSGKMSEPEALYSSSESEKFWREITASQQRTIESQARVIEEQSRVIASFTSKASNEAV